MKRKTWYWIIGAILLGLILFCGGAVGLGLFALSGIDSSSGPTFGEAVAIVRVEGIILPGEAPPPSPFGGSGGAYSQQLIDYLKRAGENDNVKAVVLFVTCSIGVISQFLNVACFA